MGASLGVGRLGAGRLGGVRPGAVGRGAGARARAGPGPGPGPGAGPGSRAEGFGGGEGDPRRQRARQAAARLLSYRIRTAAELRERLGEKGFSEAEADATVLELQEAGLQCDAEFAAAFVRTKWRTSQWSPRRLTGELRRRGLGQGDIDRGLGEVFGEARDLDARALQEAMDGGSEDAEGPEGLGIGLGGLLAERPDPEVELLEAARGRVRQMGGAPREAKRRRLSGWLQRRGYSWDVIKVVLAGAGV